MELEHLLEWTGVWQDFAVRPRSWEDLMTGVAEGKVYVDSVGDVAFACVDVASRGEPRFPTWDDAVIEALFESTGDLEDESSQTLIACGRVADDVVANEAECFSSR